MTRSIQDHHDGLRVVIPLLDDAAALACALPAVLAEFAPGEVVVCDGGSVDRGPDLARGAGIRVVAAGRGRAVQLNAGAAAAGGTGLVFLHADAWFPCGGRAAVGAALARGRVGGCFRRRFDTPSLFLRLTCRLAETRARHTGWFLGDQGIFASRAAFEAVGGFPPLTVFEDLEFSRRLRRHGPTTVVRPLLVTSARRFERDGPVWGTLRDLVLTLRHLTARSAIPGNTAPPRPSNG